MYTAQHLHMPVSCRHALRLARGEWACSPACRASPFFLHQLHSWLVCKQVVCQPYPRMSCPPPPCSLPLGCAQCWCGPPPPPLLSPPPPSPPQLRSTLVRASLSSSGRELLCGSEDGRVYIWDTYLPSEQQQQVRVGMPDIYGACLHLLGPAGCTCRCEAACCACWPTFVVPLPSLPPSAAAVRAYLPTHLFNFSALPAVPETDQACSGGIRAVAEGERERRLLRQGKRGAPGATAAPGTDAASPAAAAAAAGRPRRSRRGPATQEQELGVRGVWDRGKHGDGGATGPTCDVAPACTAVDDIVVGRGGVVCCCRGRRRRGVWVGAARGVVLGGGLWRCAQCL